MFQEPVRGIVTNRLQSEDDSVGRSDSDRWSASDPQALDGFDDILELSAVALRDLQRQAGLVEQQQVSGSRIAGPGQGGGPVRYL